MRSLGQRAAGSWQHPTCVDKVIPHRLYIVQLVSHVPNSLQASKEGRAGLTTQALPKFNAKRQAHSWVVRAIKGPYLPQAGRALGASINSSCCLPPVKRQNTGLPAARMRVTHTPGRDP